MWEKKSDIVIYVYVCIKVVMHMFLTKFSGNLPISPASMVAYEIFFFFFFVSFAMYD